MPADDRIHRTKGGDSIAEQELHPAFFYCYLRFFATVFTKYKIDIGKFFRIFLLQIVCLQTSYQIACILGTKFEGFREITFGFGILSEPVIDVSAGIICVRNELVFRYGTVEVVESSVVIFERNLCESTIHIRLLDIGFGIYYFVEILYSQHIIVEVHSIIAHTHKVLGIDLTAYDSDIDCNEER